MYLAGLSLVVKSAPCHLPLFLCITVSLWPNNGHCPPSHPTCTLQMHTHLLILALDGPILTFLVSHAPFSLGLGKMDPVVIRKPPSKISLGLYEGFRTWVSIVFC